MLYDLERTLKSASVWALAAVLSACGGDDGTGVTGTASGAGGTTGSGGSTSGSAGSSSSAVSSTGTGGSATASTTTGSGGVAASTTGTGGASTTTGSGGVAGSSASSGGAGGGANGGSGGTGRTPPTTFDEKCVEVCTLQDEGCPSLGVDACAELCLLFGSLAPEPCRTTIEDIMDCQIAGGSASACDTANACAMETEAQQTACEAAE
jgi:hypothetical protein